MVQQQQLARAHAENLAREFAANAAAGTADEHHLSGQIPLQQVDMRRHRFAAQQVFDVEFLEILHRHLAAGEIGHARDGAQMDGDPFERADDFIAPHA